jgi:hypothetical protein
MSTFATVRCKKVGDRLNVIIKFTGRSENDDDIAAYVRELRRIYALKEPMKILYDARDIGIPSFSQMHQQAALMRELDPETRRLVVGCAIVGGDVLRGFLAVLFKLRPPACVLEIFPNVEEARTYLLACQ